MANPNTPDMARFLDLMKTATRWKDIPGNTASQLTRAF
jgi:hypothetical protein